MFQVLYIDPYVNQDKSIHNCANFSKSNDKVEPCEHKINTLNSSLLLNHSVYFAYIMKAVIQSRKNSNEIVVNDSNTILNRDYCGFHRKLFK